MNKYLALLAIILFVYGCDKPSPVVLEPETGNSDNVEIEVITSDPESEISKGIDSTGTVEEFLRFTNYIAVSGIKITDNSFTTNISSAQAIFFDRTVPYFDLNERLIGYRTRILGNVSFNDVEANQVPFKIRFKDRNGIRDTTLGWQHLLYRGRGNHSDPFNFIYNSAINFKLRLGVALITSFDIPTPPEITGSLVINRSNANNRLQAMLTWTNTSPLPVEVIIGAKLRNNHIAIPLYKIKTADDGSLVIPPGLLNAIPKDRFNQIVVSLVRKYEGKHVSTDNELFVRSQSIHSIVVEIP
ncbi:MAG: hypothetical protein IPM56_17980 [Ignavibacteriales bacterium]|nr:MAG: hypothetical protein IPM56_17980 [Ignavibacteriales bacterium]